MPEANKEAKPDANPFAGFVNDHARDGVAVPPPAPPAKGADKGANGNVPAAGVVPADEVGDDDKGEGADDAGADDEAGEEGADEAGDESDEGKKLDDKKDGQQPPPKKKLSVQQRINQAVFRQREAERRAEDAERRAQEAERRATSKKDDERSDLTPDGKGAKGAKEGKPNPSDYEYGELDPTYIADLTDFEVERKFAEREQKLQEKRDADARTEIETRQGQQVTALVESGKEKYEDFDDVVLKSPVVMKEIYESSSPIYELLLETDPKVARDIAYHIASNPKEAREVLGKPPHAQAAYFGRLEAKFTADSAAPPPKPKPKLPQAPPPPNQPRGAGGRFTVDANTSDFAAFEQMVKNQNKG